MTAEPWDVVVVGGGNAGLCAALSARAAGARTLVLEAAPSHMRGGNSRHTRNLRVAHDAPTAVLVDRYTADEFFDDLLRVSGETDEALARLVIERSTDAPAWMHAHGARFQPSLAGTLHLGRTNAFFLGGGTALMNGYYASAARAGVVVRYDTTVEALLVHDGRCDEIVARSSVGDLAVQPGAVVLASGGFEANLAWLGESWGPAAAHFIVRGTPYNTGVVLRQMLEAGAMAIGDPRACHAVAVDARAPAFDGGIVTRLDTLPLGIVVNRHGQRFYDEGEDLWPKRYAVWGGLIAAQDGQIAYSITDAKVAGLSMPSVFPPIEAASIDRLAAALELPEAALTATVRAFNAATRPGRFDHTTLDECRTDGLTPAKSHWARPLDTPPFRAYPLRPGITFTYLGLRVDASARVQWTQPSSASNVFAAGEIMAGNILRRGYTAGVGMTIGTVFGRLAGEAAAAHARG